MGLTTTLTRIHPGSDDRLRVKATQALADEVRDVLLECGFTTGEIRHWVDTYTRRAESSDADAFLDWISTYEHHWWTRP